MADGVPWQVVTLGVVLALGAGVAAWSWMPRAFGQPTEVNFDGLEAAGDGAYVRLSGVAHYEGTVAQPVPGGPIRGPSRRFRFVFAPSVATEREARVIVATERPPPASVDLEHLVVEGVLSRGDARTLPAAVREGMAKMAGVAVAADAWVLEPVRVIADDATFVEP